MRSRHFGLKEWFSRKMFDSTVKKFGEERLWGLLDDRIILAADWFRDRYGAIVINNWATGGGLQLCGFRDFDSGIGAALSAHKYGRAADLHFTTVSPEEVRQDIKKTPPPLITEVELDTPGWLHIGTRNHNQEGIMWLPKP